MMKRMGIAAVTLLLPVAAIALDIMQWIVVARKGVRLHGLTLLHTTALGANSRAASFRSQASAC